MKHLLWLLLFLLCVPNLFCQAGRLKDGNDLLSKCGTAVRFSDSGNLPNQDTFDVAWCYGYIEGFRGALIRVRIDQAKTYEDYKNPLLAPLHLCVPFESTNGEVSRVVVNYLRANPTHLHDDVDTAMAFALSGSYTCTK